MRGSLCHLHTHEACSILLTRSTTAHSHRCTCSSFSPPQSRLQDSSNPSMFPSWRRHKFASQHMTAYRDIQSQSQKIQTNPKLHRKNRRRPTISGHPSSSRGHLQRRLDVAVLIVQENLAAGLPIVVKVTFFLSGRCSPARVPAASDLVHPSRGVHQFPGEMAPLFPLLAVLFSHCLASPNSDGAVACFLSECTFAMDVCNLRAASAFHRLLMHHVDAPISSDSYDYSSNLPAFASSRIGSRSGVVRYDKS
ncbi:uncharacterized protein LOC124689977 [Lolium rigidum]|uniref:uncharacterized protein LOC124689977 n=1 Tax=Lolium rigidum TaxID=89674 RepID=UPI001F5D6BD5|nr:uncharacterized protein LOC124689977 [Lolium rigidum]